MMIGTPMAAQAVLDREYLEVRAKILELAATFDRMERGGGLPTGDTRAETGPARAQSSDG